MCARFSLRTSAEDLERLFGVQMPPELEEAPELRPTDEVLAVVNGREGRKARLLRWGLIPSWAETPDAGRNLFNARSESAFEKPAFRLPFRKRRCLIPADSFIEWADAEVEEPVADEALQASLDLGPALPKRAGPKIKRARKIPFAISMRGGEPFAFAGLWDIWRQNEKAEPVRTCTILTTDANDLVSPIHDRMPCILGPEDFDLWMDPELEEPSALMPLLRPYPATAMRSERLAA